MTKRRLLWIGDAGATTGFARVTHRVIETLQRDWDPFVLGLNYNGDPHNFPYPIFPCRPGGDAFGLGRVKELIEKIGPAVIVLQQDPWNFQDYLHQIGDTVPVIGIVAVDGKCCRGTELNGLAHAIFWTEFGEKEARLGGYSGSSQVIPLGIDLDVYKPQDQKAVRERMSLPRILESRGLPEDTFIVGYVGRNQLRKRLDLTLQYFAEWVQNRQISNACLWVHSAPTGDDAFDLPLLGKYFGISDRLMLPTVSMRYGVSEDLMARVYSLFDVFITTTLGEGWGFPIMEAMGCGVPCIVPRWSGLEDWATAAMQIPCTSISAHPPHTISSIGGIADRKATIESLDAMYRNRVLRRQYRQAGLDLVQQPKFQWSAIGELYLECLDSVMVRQPIETAV